MEETINNLKHIPWWILPLFTYLVWVGIKSLKTKVISIFRSSLLPVIFVVLSIIRLSPLLYIDSRIPYLWFISLIIGILPGWLFSSRQNIEVDKKNLLIKVPGSWITLFLLLSIFFINFYFGAKKATDNSIFKNLNFIFSIVFLSTLPRGVMIGRSLNFIYRLTKGPYVNLSKK